MLPRFGAQRILFGFLLFCSFLLLIRIFLYGPETAADRIKSVVIPSIQHPKGVPYQDKNEDSDENDLMKCHLDSECKSPEMKIKLGAETHHSSPFGCINNLRIFEAKDLKKGLNMIVINENTQSIEQSISFDVAKTDEKLISWLQSFREYRSILLVSLGDIAEHISPDARKLLTLFGAEKIQKWRHGTGYALFGQWGLIPGSAVEIIYSLSEEISSKSIFEDCFGFPLGDLRNVTYLQNTGVVNRVDESKLAEFLEPMKSDVRLGDFWRNCGRDMACDNEEIPMHFYSGQNKDDVPKMCVAEKYVFTKDLNEAGRGLNIAVIDPKSRTVVRLGHFDTYEQESSGLERFLDLVEPGQIVAAVSFDEASTMLSEMAKRILYELGSSMIDRIKFRAAWYFVGQKGINSYTPFEDLNYPSGNNWATPIKTWLCVPISLSGHKDLASMKVVQRQNIPKRHFCAKYDGHDGFCNSKVIDTPITPKPLDEKERHEDPIFNVPIIVTSGVDFNSLRITLDSILNQPGINTQMLLVSHNAQYKEAADLATLYHGKPLSLNASSNYNEMVRMSLEAVFALFPKANEVILIEEETILSPDFLYSISQLLPIFRADPNLSIIQSFNYNGHLSRDPQLIYRVDNHSPSYAFLMKREIYEKKMRGNSDCCNDLHHWSLRDTEALVFDISRLSINQTNQFNFSKIIDLSNHQKTRKISDSEYELDVDPIKTRESYQISIFDQINNSTIFGSNQTEIWSSCESNNYSKVLHLLFDGFDQSDFVIEYSTNEEFEKLLDCFGVIHFGGFVPGKFRKFTRFFIDDIHVILRRV